MTLKNGGPNITQFVGLKTFDYSEAKRVLQRHNIHAFASH